MRRCGRWFATAIVVTAGLSGCGMGDRMVTGFGNSGNHIFTDPTQELADVLGSHPGVPPVTDEMLVSGFDAIRRRASEGDPQAVLILFQVAARQRQDAE